MDYMDRELHEECGVFGIIGHQDASQICYYGLHSLQHRGQEAAGICCENNGKMIFHKGEGLVTEVFNQDKLKELQGNSAIDMLDILLLVEVELLMFNHLYLELCKDL